jgi:hypothetical protein
MSSAEYEGYLEKKGTEGLGTSWKKRYFALVGKFLFYYKAEKDFKGVRRQPISGAILGTKRLQARKDRFPASGSVNITNVHAVVISLFYYYFSSNSVI